LDDIPCFGHEGQHDGIGDEAHIDLQLPCADRFD
jgi:hypothetical protein